MPDKIHIVFDGVTCMLVAEVNSSDPIRQNPDVVVAIDTDPGELEWDAQESQAQVWNWSPRRGYGENFNTARGTVRARYIQTGQTFEVNFSVEIAFISGGPNTTMTVHDVSISLLP